MYNLVTIQTMNDKTVARSMLNYPTKNDVLGALYTTMASAVASNKVVKCACVIITDDGFYDRMELLDKTENEESAE